jgi:hypothetical protein
MVSSRRRMIKQRPYIRLLYHVDDTTYTMTPLAVLIDDILLGYGLYPLGRFPRIRAAESHN